MAERAVRFGVRDSDGRQAATWKCWNSGSTNNDVYLACRALKGELKASFHQSGRWHIAFSQGFYDTRFPASPARPSSRFTDSWPRPKDLVPGTTLAFRIVVPWFSATIDDKAEKGDVAWAASAPTGQAVEFGVLICHPEAVGGAWPGKNSMNTSPVGCFSIPNGEVIWIVRRLTPFVMATSLQGSVTLLGGAEAKALSGPGLRAILFGNEADGSRVMYDVPIASAPDSVGG